METYQPENNPYHHQHILHSLATCLKQVPQTGDIWSDEKQSTLDNCMGDYFDTAITTSHAMLAFTESQINRAIDIVVPDFEE